MSPKPKSKKVTVPELVAMKGRGEKITMVTCYDATFMRILDQAGVEMVLVGDSLGMVIQGRSSTLEVTLEDMIYHGRIVARGLTHAHLVLDMPFGSYQVSVEDAQRNAARLVKEGGAESVKVEGGREIAPVVRAIHRMGVPVVGHLGLTPQSIHQLGGFRIQGRTKDTAQALLEDAHALEEAGAFAIVLEGIPGELAEKVSAAIRIPTVGIGAGPGCDGQVLVIYDLLGMDNNWSPKFAKKYANLNDVIVKAVSAYIEDVKSGSFPGPEHTFH